MITPSTKELDALTLARKEQVIVARGSAVTGQAAEKGVVLSRRVDQARLVLPLKRPSVA